MPAWRATNIYSQASPKVDDTWARRNKANRIRFQPSSRGDMFIASKNDSEMTYSTKSPEDLLITRNLRVPTWFFSNYSPAFARPEEMRFDVACVDGRALGQIVFTDFKSDGANMSTPWGDIKIVRKPRYEIRKKDGILAVIRMSLFRTRTVLSVQDGVVMRFSSKVRNETMRSSSEWGPVEVVYEGAFAPDGRSSREITRREWSAKWRESRPQGKRYWRIPESHEEGKTAESVFFNRWRVHVPKELPGQEDFLASLVILTCYRAILGESEYSVIT